jgi:hypothetical protein
MLLSWTFHPTFVGVHPRKLIAAQSAYNAVFDLTDLTDPDRATILLND